MLTDYFNFKKAKKIHDNFYLSFEKPLEEQDEMLLDEDLFYAKYDDNEIKITFDIGWYGGMEIDNLENKFIIFVIINCDWEHPYLKILTRDLDALKYYIEVTKNFIESGALKNKFKDRDDYCEED